MRSLAAVLPAPLAVLLGAAMAFSRDGSRAPRPLFSHGRSPVHVGAAPRGVGDTTSAVCARCHADIAREWEASQHATSWRDEVFQAAYTVEPMQFCRNCHAPTARAGRAPDAVAAHEGVSCAVCHVRDGHVLGPARAPTASAVGAHATRPLPAMRTTSFCAGCHQFNFPGDPGVGERAVFATDEPMQDTHGEWGMSASAAEGTHCQDCHMPWVTGPDGRRHRSHRFVGGSDVGLLREAVRVEGAAHRDGTRTVLRVAVVPHRIGHAFPTGDLFRRAELVVWPEGDDEHAQTLAMAREFRPVLERDPRGRPVFVRRQSSDTRVPPPGTGPIAPRTLTFEGAPRRLRWRLDHLLMPTPMAASQGFGPARVRTTVLEGSFEALTPPAPGDPR